MHHRLAAPMAPHPEDSMEIFNLATMLRNDLIDVAEVPRYLQDHNYEDLADVVDLMLQEGATEYDVLDMILDHTDLDYEREMAAHRYAFDDALAMDCMDMDFGQLQQGDVIHVNWEGEPAALEVSKASPRQIVLRNVEESGFDVPLPLQDMFRPTQLFS